MNSGIPPSGVERVQSDCKANWYDNREGYKLVSFHFGSGKHI